ncbi:MAG: leucine-rich repeat domain-containing protein [Clostridia bacterium]|nr:leucine-rich repeat domain-containing protein [Clostridia bacterium]
MKGKILFVLSLIAVLTVLLSVSVSAQEPTKAWDISNTASGDDVTAELYLNDDGETYTLSLTGVGNMKDWSLDSHAPWWSYREKITASYVGEGITELGGYAFSEFHIMDEVYLPSTMKSIGGAAFRECYGITSIDIPDAVTTLSSYAFHNCTGLVSVNMPSELTKIGNYVFNNCRELKSITIPEKVTSIGSYAFNSCVELVEINLCATKLSSFDSDDRVFNDAGEEAGGITLRISKNVTQIPTLMFDSNDSASTCPKITAVIFEEGSACKTIGTYAFRNNPIERLELPSSVTTIGKYAFSKCTSLEEAVIPSTVTVIGTNAFKGCSSAVIYCQASNRPSGWSEGWQDSTVDIVWGYEKLPSMIFTYKGYSTSDVDGQMAIGFDINYTALERYERLLDKSVDMGVIFASFEQLNGKEPLDAHGNAVKLESGMVAKKSLAEYKYTYYDFVLTNITDDYKNHSFVISAYIFTGEKAAYVQGNGISDTVYGITYNEARMQEEVK